MPHKDPERAKEYHAKYMKEVWYPKNKEKHLAYVRRNKQRVTAFIAAYKKDRSCTDCGFSGKEFPFVLDFDHLDGGLSKKFTIGSWSHSVLSIEAIEKEIEKCELVCANCHRIRTFSKKVVEG
ncbi:MAG: hypothetical protein QG636_224 [Patescibacteria group bacterium]|jgi:hypothetical protein|nr:hypothetical protein [Patescibacteria group bacterium]